MVDGTVDVTNADMGGVTYISVASGIKMTAAQLLSVDDVVITAGSGSVEVEVSTQAVIRSRSSEQWNARAFSSGDLLDLTAATGGPVTAEQITTGTTNVNAQKQATSNAPQR